MKTLYKIGRAISRKDQKLITGGVKQPCTQVISCPSGCGGGSLTCTSETGSCYSNYESFAIKCDNDPWLYCCPT